MTSLAFAILAALTIAAALAVVFSSRTFQSAVWLMICLIAVAGHFLLLGNELIAILQIIVYAGAVVVLFVFVIQLLNMDPQEAPLRLFLRRREWALWTGVAFALMLGIFIFTRGREAAASALVAGQHGMGAIRALCVLFLNQYLLVFELTSVLLLAAIIGAILLAKREYLKR